MIRTKLIERNTNKITVVLVNAVVELILILLLLLNSVFSYLIVKYAEFFGVERPCPWCTRLDHIFDQTKTVCDAHAYQISKLGCCSNHHNLPPSLDKKDKKQSGNAADDDSNQGDEESASLSISVDEMEELEPVMDAKEELQLFLDLKHRIEDHDEDSALNMLDQMEVLLLDFDINVEPNLSQDYQNSLFFHAKRTRNLVVSVQELAWEMHLDVRTASPSAHLAQMDSNENESDVSIGTEIPDVDYNEGSDQESIHSYNCPQDETDDHGLVQVKDQMVEFQCLSLAQDRELILKTQPRFLLELNDIEEDKVPYTPASVDSPNQFRRNLAFLETMDTGNEESLDGSVTSELEGGEGVVTIERLKSALRAERKSLRALYAELEEERSAAAEAASQTMAMINRLQEEKAAVQVEAFQYQRMMEEQSEYDQEALQLMNDIIVKREKEKQELEKELEVYRMKLLHYETKEKMRVLRKSNSSTRSGLSSATRSIDAEDSDGLSIDLYQEAMEEEGDHNTPVGTVMNLEESLADFEEERLSILAELNKVLEEKLMLLDEENGDEHAHMNGHSNGFVKEMNGRHHQPRRLDFDATNHENEFDENGLQNSYASKLKSVSTKVSIEAEVDHLYERMQGLEADRDFIKHCVSSLRKGDRGMELLQEILQHVRDLHYIELQVTNLNDNTALFDS